MTDTAPVSGHTEGPWAVAETSDTVIDSRGYEICRVPAGPRTDDYLKLIASLPTLQLEVWRLAAENERLKTALAGIIALDLEDEIAALRATVETLRSPLLWLTDGMTPELLAEQSVVTLRHTLEVMIDKSKAALKAAEGRE